MYRKIVPHKNFTGVIRNNQEVQFNLTTHEFFKLLVEFKAIFDWMEGLSTRDPDGVTDTREVIEYYDNLEQIILAAWGELDETGDHFRKAGRFEFAESSLFHATMEMLVADPNEAEKMINGLMPEGLADLIKKLDANAVALIANKDTPEAMRQELERLRAQEAERMAQKSPTAE